MTPEQWKAICARDESDRKAYPGNLSVPEIDRKTLIAYVKELQNFRACAKSACQGWRELYEMKEAEIAALKAAAGKVVCQRCNDSGFEPWSDFGGAISEPCPDCAELRELLKEKPPSGG